MTRKILALSLIAAAFASPALAQDDEEPTVQYNPETHVEFDILEVDGELVGPSMTSISEVQHRGFAPMIELREDFDPEMDASVNQVK